MKCWSLPDSWSIILPGGSPAPHHTCCPARGGHGWTDRQWRLLSPWHSNFLAGVVSSNFPSMSGGPAQRAMPGSLYPVLTQLESQRRLQLQYRGLAPMALQEEDSQYCTCCSTEGTGLRGLGTGHNFVTWLGCHVMGGPSAPLFLDPPELLPAVGGLGHTALLLRSHCCQPHSPRDAPWLRAGALLSCPPEILRSFFSALVQSCLGPAQTGQSTLQKCQHRCMEAAGTA